MENCFIAIGDYDPAFSPMLQFLVLTLWPVVGFFLTSHDAPPTLPRPAIRPGGESHSNWGLESSVKNVNQTVVLFLLDEGFRKERSCGGSLIDPNFTEGWVPQHFGFFFSSLRNGQAKDSGHVSMKPHSGSGNGWMPAADDLVWQWVSVLPIFTPQPPSPL